MGLGVTILELSIFNFSLKKASGDIVLSNHVTFHKVNVYTYGIYISMYMYCSQMLYTFGMYIMFSTSAQEWCDSHLASESLIFTK